MRLHRGTYRRVAEKTGYTEDYVRKVYHGKRRNWRLELLLMEEEKRWRKSERLRKRLGRRQTEKKR